MKKYRQALILFFSSLILLTSTNISAQSKAKSVQQEGYALLTQWVDKLLDYQLEHSDASLDGAILCPACGRVHGRIGDAVLPIMYMADESKDEKYIVAAKRLMKWMENVNRHDGAWMNDINVSTWDGTTVFMAISLYETLEHHGHLLDTNTRMEWEQQLKKAGVFVYKNDFIFSRKRDGWRNMNINYSASATYVLYALGKKFDLPQYVEKATMLAKDLHPYFTENEGFLFGEGPEIWNKTPNRVFPIDLLYNVEESLPNMVSYAQLANDVELMTLLEKSLNTHLQFMLPDGAWDNSWGTRNFKWMYWGGRTSDGFMGGYYALADKYPAFGEAVKRNIELLKSSTRDGLLSGMHYNEMGEKACIHHTFGHAKAIASFLNKPVVEEQITKLPSDTAFGVKFIEDINTWLIAAGDWRNTLTANDAEYKVKGTHPMGGALSMAWHKSYGPIFAATMNNYQMIEAPNMQAYYMQKFQMNGTPRIELVENDVMYSNLDDLNTKVNYTKEGENHVFITKTHLVDFNQNYSSLGGLEFEVAYTFSSDGIAIKTNLTKGARLVLPIIAHPKWEENIKDKKLTIKKGNVDLTLEANTKIELAPSESNNRIFNPIPGFSFIPAIVYPNEKGEIYINLSVKQLNQN